MSDMLSVSPSGLATTTTNNNHNNHNSSRNNERRRQEDHPPRHHTTASSPSSSSAASTKPRITLPSNVIPSTAQLSSPSHTHTHTSPSPPPPPAAPPSTMTGAGAGAVVRIDDASPIVLFTLQYSAAVVQGVTIYILSVVFSILQLVSGHLNDGSPSSSSGLTTAAGVRKKIGPGISDDEQRRQRQQQRRRRWSGSRSENGNGSSSTSATTWAQNLIAHTQLEQEQQGHQIRPQSQSSYADRHAEASAGGSTGGGGSLAQRVEVLRFLGSTIATLVGGGYTSFGSTASAMFSSTEEKKGDSDSTKAVGGGGEGEMTYSSRIRRALVKTLSGHVLPIPIPRGIKRVTFNDHVQFHTTNARRRPTRFEDEDEEDEDGDGSSTSSSPVLRFFSAGFSAAGMSSEEPMSSSPTPATPVAAGGVKGKGQKKNRPPSIMPSARDRRQLQEQDELEDATAQIRASGFSVTNGRSTPVSTTTMTPGTSTVAKKLVSTITIALPPLSRPRKQQQQQPPLSSRITTTSAAGAATTSTTTATMVSTPTPASFSPGTGVAGGAGGLASALLSSLMMPAAPGPISDAARSLLTISSTSPTGAGENSAAAAVLSDSDSSKSSGQRIDVERTRSAPSKLSSFLQQHRLTRQQQQQQQQQPPHQQSQMQGLFSPGEYTTSPLSASPLSPSSAPVLTVDVRKANSSRITAPSSFSSSAPGTSTTIPTTPTSPTTSLMRPRSIYSIHSTVSATVSSAVAVVIGTDLPPPSVPTSLTTSMSLFLSSANSTNGALLSPRLDPVGSRRVKQHQRKRSASVDLSGMVSTTTAMMVSGIPSPMTRSGSEVDSGVPPPTPPMSGSGGRSLMYKLTHPQRYKRELELELQQQKQSRDTNSLSSATSSPSASQVAFPTTFSTTSITSVASSSSTGSIQERPSSSSAVQSEMVSPTRVVYPFSQSFADLPPSLSYLSDHTSSPPSTPSYSALSAMMTGSLPSPTLSPSLSPAATTTTVAATGEIYQPHPPPTTSGAEKEMPALEESTTPPLSLFFPSPTTQHRALPSSSPLLASSPPTSALLMLSNVKDSLSQLRRSPSPRPTVGARRSTSTMEDESSHAHTTFAACGFSISSSPPSSSSST